MKKILFVVNEFPAASETFIIDQIKYFEKRGFHVHVLAHKFNGNHEKLKCFNSGIQQPLINRILYGIATLFDRKKFLNKLMLLNIFKYGRYAINQVLLLMSSHFTKYNDYDIIYCHFGNNGKFICHLKEVGIINTNTKICVHFHGVDLNIKVFTPSFYKVLNNYSDIIVVGSNLAVEYLKELNIYSKEKVIKVPVSLDLVEFPERKLEERDVLQILSVGRLVDLKGHLEAIEVIYQFKKRFNKPFIYYIVGAGPLLSTLKDKIREYNLESSIILLGAMSHRETLSLMYRSDLYLYCGKIDKEGRQEMQGLSIIEAMASGCTLVSSSVGGVKEYLTEHNAYVCAAGDTSCFVDKMVRAVTDKEKTRQLNEFARYTALNNFDRSKNYEKLIQALN